MYQMILLVLDNMDRCADVLDAWEAAGVRGITILESTGLGRVRRMLRNDLPLMPSITTLLQSREERHRTLFTVVESEALADAVVAATEETVGDLSHPNVGFLVVLPVTRVVGMAPEQ